MSTTTTTDPDTDALTEAATEAGAVSVRAAVALAREELRRDPGDEPRSPHDLMTTLRAADPELFRAADGSADGGEGNASTAPRDLNAQLRRQFQRQRRGY